MVFFSFTFFFFGSLLFPLLSLSRSLLSSFAIFPLAPVCSFCCPPRERLLIGPEPLGASLPDIFLPWTLSLSPLPFSLNCCLYPSHWPSFHMHDEIRAYLQYSNFVRSVVCFSFWNHVWQRCRRCWCRYECPTQWPQGQNTANQNFDILLRGSAVRIRCFPWSVCWQCRTGNYGSGSSGLSFVQYAKRKEKEESWAEDNESHASALRSICLHVYSSGEGGGLKKRHPACTLQNTLRGAYCRSSCTTGLAGKKRRK